MLKYGALLRVPHWFYSSVPAQTTLNAPANPEGSCAKLSSADSDPAASLELATNLKAPAAAIARAFPAFPATENTKSDVAAAVAFPGAGVVLDPVVPDVESADVMPTYSNISIFNCPEVAVAVTVFAPDLQLTT
jgi:hypothetical protein